MMGCQGPRGSQVSLPAGERGHLGLGGRGRSVRLGLTRQWVTAPWWQEVQPLLPYLFPAQTLGQVSPISSEPRPQAAPVPLFTPQFPHLIREKESENLPQEVAGRVTGRDNVETFSRLLNALLCYYPSTICLQWGPWEVGSHTENVHRVQVASTQVPAPPLPSV